MNSQFIGGNEAKHITPADNTDRKLCYIADRANMTPSSNLQKKAKAVGMHILKRRSVNTSKVTCKGSRQKGITYEMSTGLDFPDNFMAIMGWRRVKV